MTDSMKFGPEWLRSSGVGGIGNSTSSNFSTSNLNNSGGGSGTGSYNNSSSALHLPAPRNMFPEFRYGREEMLSLFEKNCNIPDILPWFKNIFVEKVQCPLALTPSSDEETVPQNSAPTTQRPTWLQRSPVGFSSSARGTGRGGSVDRGRMRGKSVYHPVFRPTAMLDDDLRSASMKIERGWAERNGAGDSIGGISCGIAPDWNGTPALSPRKEFSSHPRNMENWRRNRNEDGSGDAPNSSLGNTDGWRGSTSTSFGSTHRWGRSTSWRDDDIIAANTDVTYGCGNNITMQRSYSTITTVNERGGYVGNSLSKTSQNTTNYSSSGGPITHRTHNSMTVGSAHSSRNNQWTSSSVNIGGGNEGEMEMPEWAMENPSESGGTFDASGAFHGSADEEDSVSGRVSSRKSNRKKSSSSSEGSVRNEMSKVDEKALIDRENIADDILTSSLKCINSAVERDLLEKGSNNDGTTTGLHEQNVLKTKSKAPQKSELHDVKTVTLTSLNESDSSSSGNMLNIQSPVSVQNKRFFGNDAGNGTIKSSLEVHIDFSDRMKEVADDMVEKLIMDDDSAASSDGQTSSGSKQNTTSTAETGMRVKNAYVSPNVAILLKQSTLQQQAAAAQNNVTVSPTLPSITSGNHKSLPLYDVGGVADHAATLQQHLHLQQRQMAVTATTASGLSHPINAPGASTDFWYYRDPQSKVQGPFTAIEMTEWYRAGYFDEHLYVRRACDTRFRALGEMTKLCHGEMPFTHSHLISLSSENMSHSAIMQPKTTMMTTDFGGGLNQQQEELKGSVTAAADSLSAAVKNVISSVDMSQMLNMHFRRLQDQYLRHQKVLILNELSKTEIYQSLTPSERDAMVRQKVQTHGLPEYLTSLNGLSNSLATLNPTASHQLFETISECSKKGQLFNTGVQQQHQQQTNPVNTYLDNDDFVLNQQRQQQSQQQLHSQFPRGPYTSILGPGTANNLANKIVSGSDSNMSSNEFNLSLFLRSGANTGTTQQAPPQQQVRDFMVNSNSNDFLTEQSMLSGQSPMMQMWMSQLDAVASGVTNSQPQTQLIQQQPQVSQAPHLQNNHWSSNLLVGIPLPVMPGTQITSGGAVVPQTTNLPTSIWDLPPIEQQSQSQQKLDNTSAEGFNEQESQGLLQQHERSDTDQAVHQKLHRKDDGENFTSSANQQQQIDLNSIETCSQSQQLVVTTMKPQKEELNDKQLKKRTCKQQIVPVKVKGKDENNLVNNRTIEEERRREAADEKRRQKEERKRQQSEEEKRRLHQVEEERRRQIQEEKERQQQIQAQRRKALLANSNGSNGSTIINSTGEAAIIPTVPANKQSKEQQQQRVQSSIAPWSIQSNANKSGPCLAEIQKAERRERRADQQRQMELLEKQIRSGESASTSILKWMAAPLPVKNLAEIQAEEAKRLASEHLEMQRRKEQEQQAALAAANLNGSNTTLGVGSASSSGNMSVIWSGTKVWGSSNIAGFWEEPIKFNTSVLSNATTATIVGSGLSNSNNIGGKQTQTFQQKPMISAANHHHALNASRNLRKSQTISVMQNTTTHSATSNSKNNQQTLNNTVVNKQVKPQQHKVTDVDKKNNAKPNNNATILNKKDDFENEFTGWCTRSLNNMKANIDGESKEYTEFAKQFLERRSKYKNLQRAQNAHNDDMCKPAPAITPSGNDNLDNKSKQKKMRKNKMTKLDARILGFSVTAAEGRINVGDRDYGDAP